MNEKLSGANPEHVVKMPSKIRIRQRLGQISTNHAFKKDFVPRIERFGRKTLETDDFLVALSTKMSEFEGRPSGELSDLGQARIPKIIAGIVLDEQQQNYALERWPQLQAEQQPKEPVEAA
jgi:hypothetical protein